jgi:hypothetical protein
MTDLTQWESSRARAEEEGDRIPQWPARSRGAIPFREAYATSNLSRDMREINAASARMRSDMYRDGAPMVCLQCGQVTDPYGNLPCGH